MGTSGAIAHHLSNSGGSRSVLGLGLPSPFVHHARTCGVMVELPSKKASTKKVAVGQFDVVLKASLLR